MGPCGAVLRFAFCVLRFALRHLYLMAFRRQAGWRLDLFDFHVLAPPARTSRLSKLQLLDPGDCISKTLDVTTAMTQLDAKWGLPRRSYETVKSQRCNPHRVSLMLSPRRKSCGIIALPPYKFDLWIFIDLLTLLPSWTALCLNWKCCVANFHVDVPETRGEDEFWACWCSGNATGHITGYVTGSRAYRLLT